MTTPGYGPYGQLPTPQIHRQPTTPYGGPGAAPEPFRQPVPPSPFPRPAPNPPTPAASHNRALAFIGGSGLILGGSLTLISPFLPWLKIAAIGVATTMNGFGNWSTPFLGDAGNSGFAWGWLPLILGLLVIAAGAASVFVKHWLAPTCGGLCGLLATIICLIFQSQLHSLVSQLKVIPLASVDLSIGPWVGVLGGLIALIGGIVGAIFARK